MLGGDVFGVPEEEDGNSREGFTPSSEASGLRGGDGLCHRAITFMQLKGWSTYDWLGNELRR